MNIFNVVSYTISIIQIIQKYHVLRPISATMKAKLLTLIAKTVTMRPRILE